MMLVDTLLYGAIGLYLDKVNSDTRALFWIYGDAHHHSLLHCTQIELTNGIW